jgi:hypothetical protein
VLATPGHAAAAAARFADEAEAVRRSRPTKSASAAVVADATATEAAAKVPA